MNILVIGGTVFLGRHFVEAALKGGHTVTLFHRGKSNPDLFPEIEHIHGDRRSPDDLRRLGERSWEAVVDPSAYFPKDVELLLGEIGDRIDHYTIISSVSVYSEMGTKGPDEGSAVGVLTEEMPLDRITHENYGPLKVAAESKAEEMLPGKVLTIRPGLIVGPNDPSDRFTYWPWRIAAGGDVLAPGKPEESVQYIDVRDLAEWMLQLIEKGVTGLFNSTGQPMTMEEFLNGVIAALNADARLVWGSEKFLEEHQVVPFMEMPLWVPSEANGMSRTDVSRALEEGLRLRPLEQTVLDTLEWFRTCDRWEGERRAGMKPEKEKELLELLKVEDVSASG